MRTQYEAGTVTQVDLLGAQDALVGAQEALAQSRFDLAVADLTLRKTAGSSRPARPPAARGSHRGRRSEPGTSGDADCLPVTGGHSVCFLRRGVRHMGSQIHVGIDLGTSNSAVALFDGDSVSVVANASGETLTPSVVRIDGRGRRTVGRRAHPGAGDRSGEHARRMEAPDGDRRSGWRSRRRGAALLPEELSAEVIASLLADVRDAAGFPRARR